MNTLFPFIGRSGHVRVEPLHVLIQEKVLLDVRCIEGSDRRVVISEVLADGSKCVRTREIASDRVQKIFFSKS